MFRPYRLSSLSEWSPRSYLPSLLCFFPFAVDIWPEVQIWIEVRVMSQLRVIDNLLDIEFAQRSF